MAVIIGILVVAFVAGVFGSMLGVGGGVIMVPVLSLAFGVPIGGFVEAAGAIARRYHGYYFAWATIYTFWYHPMVFTSGHALGFLYMFLLLTQGAAGTEGLALIEARRKTIEVRVAEERM